MNSVHLDVAIVAPKSEYILILPGGRHYPLFLDGCLNGGNTVAKFCRFFEIEFPGRLLHLPLQHRNHCMFPSLQKEHCF